LPQKVTGGPSAGLMFTLGVYDLVTGQNLTGGRKIASTGTIDVEGNVGIIGGVQQKVVAAEQAEAEYFFHLLRIMRMPKLFLSSFPLTLFYGRD